MATTPTDPLVGTTIAQYTIVAKLGGGGMGVVYKAFDTKLSRAVALKFLPPQWSHDSAAQQRFLREAQAASATNHRNICVIHDFQHTDDGRLFIVMAYYEGQTLKQKLESGALPVGEAVEIACEVAEGLAKAHAQGVVHRDVKSGNLIVTDDGVKILDFGLAKFADALQLTIPGSTIGTVGYMAPEQTRGEEADARSDVWALGIVLYEMLTGEMPFKGAYPEAIFYAIKNEPVPQLRASGREIPETLETIVMRALEKDPEKRYQTVREFARDLRLLMGRTVPLELQTIPVPVAAPLPLRPWWQRALHRLTPISVIATLVALLTLVLGVYTLLTSPVTRPSIAVAPMINETGFPDLEAYRAALTETLISEVSDSSVVRVLPYERLLQILRRFLSEGTDVSSREALQSLTANSNAMFIIVPALVYENGAWKARAEIRNSETATNVAVYTTEPVVSSLRKEAVYSLMASLAQRIDHHFRAAGPRRIRILDTLRTIVRRNPPPPSAELRTLDAAFAFEQATSAYEQLEYAAARQAFANAATQDPRNALPLAWLTRIAVLTRQDDDAAKMAGQVVGLATTQAQTATQLFIAAVASEGQRDFAAAERSYRGLVNRHPDEPATWGELGAFQERRGQFADAVASYRQALNLDGKLARPHVELCRLYNILSESASAKEEGERALEAYRVLGNSGGKAQALMCLTDTLRSGDGEKREQARSNAEEAFKIFRAPQHEYQMVRAQFYLGLAAEAQGRPKEAAALWEESLAGARRVGNRGLEPLLLMNLGAMNAETGNSSRAVDYYRQSQRLFAALGNERRAAEIEANAAAILAEDSDKPEDGFRELQNAAGVLRTLDNKDFEVFAAKVTAGFYRGLGRYDEAARQLNEGISVAKARDLSSKVSALKIDLGQLLFDTGDYKGALEELLSALGNGSGKEAKEARIHLGRVYIRLGDLNAARHQLDSASREIQESGADRFLPPLQMALGELAYESGQLKEARSHFDGASARWIDEFADAASIEARAYLGLLDALDGRRELGRMRVQASLDRSHKSGQFPTEARCRVQLAQIYLAEKRFDDAFSVLGAIPDDRSQSLGVELRAMVHHWRSEALLGRGDRERAQFESGVARSLLEKLRETLAEQFRDSFSSRRDIRTIIG